MEIKIDLKALALKHDVDEDTRARQLMKTHYNEVVAEVKDYIAKTFSEISSLNVDVIEKLRLMGELEKEKNAAFEALNHVRVQQGQEKVLSPVVTPRDVNKEVAISRPTGKVIG